jgi:hypothetical protein
MIDEITKFIWQCITIQKYSKLMALSGIMQEKNSFPPLFNSLGVVGSQLIIDVLL